MLKSRAAATAVAVLAVVQLTACAGDTNLVRDVVAGVGAGPQVAETPEFVQRTRPQNLDYVPIGATQPQRPTPARTAEEVKAAEAELDALRARNEAAGAAAADLAGSPPPEPAKIPGGPQAVPTKKPNSPTAR